jgi:sulfite exporter TauE/SafE
MAAFGLGTLPALSLAALGLRRVMLGTLWRRRGFAALILITGMWTIWQRASTPVAAMKHHDHHQSHDSVPPSILER